ncbi:MAG TPA: MaoC/PaaZ C-terminal domain-containing protein [Myxococcales bacterium]|nr:MaoC/PaaZ C-terminal domain-containing protein [Myxococcales bacterium]
MATARKVYYQALQLGDEMPSWQCPPFDRLQIVRYAGASGDMNPLYFDEPFARAAGFRSVLAPGALALAALAQTVHEWLKAPCLRRLHVKFLKIIWPGEQLVCRGRVVGKRREGGDYLVDLDVWMENPEGEMMVRGSGTAVLFYSAQDESQRLAGGPPLIVDDPAPPKPQEPARAAKSPGKAARAKPDRGKRPAPRKAAGKRRR